MRRFQFPLFAILGLLSSVPGFADDIRQESGASILLYHRFRPNYSNFTTVTNDHFASQIEWLKDHGFHFVKLSTLVDAIREGREPPAKSVAITVDDGHFTQYKYMYPILLKYQVPATLFIYTDAIASKDMPDAISWDQLKEMQASGLIDVQAHSLSHPDFEQRRRELSPEAFNAFAITQLTKSKDILEEKLGRKISYFAWPYGSRDRSLEQLAEKLGYLASFGTGGGYVHAQSSLFSLPRFHVMNDVIGDKMASLVITSEKKHTRLADTVEKKSMPPRIKVKPAISILTEAGATLDEHATTKLVSTEEPIRPHEVQTGN